MREIVIIEDSEADAQLLRQTLTRAHVANPVQSFSNAEEAMEYLTRVEAEAQRGRPSPAVIFIDLKLPAVNGFDLLEKIRYSSWKPKPLKIVISNLDDPHSIRRAYIAGANSFLTKPLQESELRDVIWTFPGYWACCPPARKPKLNREPQVPVSPLG